VNNGILFFGAKERGWNGKPKSSLNRRAKTQLPGRNKIKDSICAFSFSGSHPQGAQREPLFSEEHVSHGSFNLV